MSHASDYVITFTDRQQVVGNGMNVMMIILIVLIVVVGLGVLGFLLWKLRAIPIENDYFDEEDNCFCSIERCFFNGSSSFRKPISCWLYTIRITNLSNGTRALNLHRWHICKDAFEKGRREGIRAYQFLREPIEVYFGKDFYEALDQAAKMLLERK